jgi:hypothetical protein
MILIFLLESEDVRSIGAILLSKTQHSCTGTAVPIAFVLCYLLIFCHKTFNGPNFNTVLKL